MQVLAPAVEVVPDEHVIHDDALAAENELAGHRRHAVAPNTLLYCPATHARHDAKPVELGAENWPNGHVTADVEHVLAPAGDVKPVAHIKHEVIPAVDVGNVTL